MPPAPHTEKKKQKGAKHMLIIDRNCTNSPGGHKVDFSKFNVRFIVQKGGFIDLEKSKPINKNEKMGDLNRVAEELLSRSQYEQVPMKELKSEPKKGDQNPPEKEKKADPEKKAEQPKGEKGKDAKKKEK